MSEQAGGVLLPTPTQELLLHAALGSGEAARRAFYEWKAQTDLAQPLDLGVYRILPLLYHNLRALNVQDAWQSRFKSVYRREWAHTQMVFQTMAKELRALHEAGIKTLALKGAPLTLLYYRDYGLRPMSDFDVLVPTAQRCAAMERLTRAGWYPRERSPSNLTDNVCAVRDGWNFENARREQFDLHWHVLLECRNQAMDDDFWTRSIPLQIADIETRTLHPTDHLLFICLHGVRWNIVSPMRWIPDALMILRGAAAQIEWARLLALAEKFRLNLRLALALNYLNEQFQASIPTDFLQALNRIRVSERERQLYEALIAPPSWYAGIRAHWYRYRFDLELEGKSNPVSRWFGFPRYWRRAKALAPGEMPRWFFTRSFQRFTAWRQARADL